MSQIYEARRRVQNAPAATKAQTAPGPSLRELAAGARPSDAQLGHRVDLPGEIKEKMEASFGADFSGVKLYESDTVAQAGAEAMTQGQNVAFAPGKLDLTSTAGQALLGHELSHVVSQARGESAGHGFLADSGLEAQADRQGMLAARGESVYQGPVSPVGASAAAAASGPMQAKKKKNVAQDALTQGAEGDIPEGMEWEDENRYLDSVMNGVFEADSNLDKRKLNNNKYSSYIKRKVASMQGNQSEQRMFLLFMQNASEGEIDNYIKNDAMTTAQKMIQSSEDLVSEDFNTRANAYANTGKQAGTAKAVMNDYHIMNGLLNEDEKTFFNNAAQNFRGDRANAKHSMEAYAPNVKDRAVRAGDYQRGLRKKYREQRRKGNTAERMHGNLETQAQYLSSAWDRQYSEYI